MVIAHSKLWAVERFLDWLDDSRTLLVLNVSGGKDSTALALLFWFESGIARDRLRLVFADTGWEAPETYAYLDVLREKIGPIDTVARPGGMLALARQKAGFPMRRGRWCTEKLKIEPLRGYFDRLIAAGFDPISVIGVRAEESDERAAMPHVEDSDLWHGWVARPLLDWPVEEVLAIHHRHGVPVNPLYLRGHDRVGCYPCINERKGSISLIAEHAPERIATIREEETWQTAERARRNASGEGNFAHPVATFFSPKAPGVSRIDDVVAWSRTERGGRSLPMFPEPPDGGCFRWGLCEAPGSDEP
jgi:3'-phosphoadenosine 5'-phosphosulfate sulfotransferase (PAPS reductase)/FAD synthetase